jgi:hypothetical protein
VEHLNSMVDEGLRTGLADVDDPGASGTIGFENKGLKAICSVVTAAGETRALESATKYPVGARIIVLLKTDGGDLTITGAEASVVLDTAGDRAEFEVTDNNGTLVWRIVGSTTAVGQVNALPADTSGFAKLELSKGTDVGELAAALIYLTEQLLAAGVIDTALTQATK